jgi:murein peptide amidase A
MTRRVAAAVILALSLCGTSAAEATTEPPGSDVPSTTAAAPVEMIAVGTSVEGRPITATRRGDPDGRRVLIFGVIHGDEQAGLLIVEQLHQLPVPPGVDLYLVASMNPDGVAANTRGNANGVDLNRNFPYNWGPIGQPGDWQYAGPSAASEPETQAVVQFISEVRPDLVIWYHQDLYMIAETEGRDGAIRDRYAELTRLPRDSPTGGTYTGVAAQWARNELAANGPQPGVAFIVELGPTLSPEEARMHAAAVLTIASESN